MAELDRDIWEIITSVLNGNPSSAERELFNRWLKEDEGNMKFYDTLLRSKHNPKIFSSEAKERVYAKIETSIQPVRNFRTIHLWTYAAVASVAILLTLSVNHFFSSNNSKNISYVEVNIPYGVKSKVSLPDGTYVNLNSGSSLKYPAQFSGKNRIVSLKGEAYFAVKKDPAHAFIVQTESVNVKVFGTQFNVKSYPEEDYFETTLVEGSVGIYKRTDTDERNTIKLVPNQKISYSLKNNKLFITEVDAELTSSWKDGKYYFEKETLQSIANKLERSFNIPVLITSGDLNKELFSGLFDRNKTIVQILDIMKLYKSFNYRLKNDTITIYKIKK